MDDTDDVILNHENKIQDTLKALFYSPSCPWCNQSISAQSNIETLSKPCTFCANDLWHKSCYTQFLLNNCDNHCPQCKNFLEVSYLSTNLFKSYAKATKKITSTSRRLCQLILSFIVILIIIGLLFFGFKKLTFQINQQTYQSLVQVLSFNESFTLKGMCFGVSKQHKVPSSYSSEEFKLDPLWYFNSNLSEWCFKAKDENLDLDMGLPFLFLDTVMSPFLTWVEVIFVVICSFLFFLILCGIIFGKICSASTITPSPPLIVHSGEEMKTKNHEESQEDSPLGDNDDVVLGKMNAKNNGRKKRKKQKSPSLSFNNLPLIQNVITSHPVYKKYDIVCVDNNTLFPDLPTSEIVIESQLEESEKEDDNSSGSSSSDTQDQNIDENQVTEEEDEIESLKL
jgi:hypothetical protein